MPTRHCDACGREVPLDYETTRTFHFDNGTGDGTTVTLRAEVEGPFGGSDVCNLCLHWILDADLPF